MIADFLMRSFNIEDVTKAFDAMSTEDLVRETRALGQKPQARLWDAAKGYQDTTFEHMVPASVPVDTQVIHQGRNTLPLFNIFQKRFARPKEAPTEELWGYNEQTFKWATGPGSFVVSKHDAELHIENMRMPPRTIPGWTTPQSNASGLNSIVYGNLVDVLRKVSDRVSIGEPRKNGKHIGSYFILARLGV